VNKVNTNIAVELADLEKMTAKQLRARYTELFGEPSRSGNRRWLFRRCAWRVQALAEGGLCERARRRATELARDVDIRAIPPAGMKMSPLDHPPDVVSPARNHIHRDRDARLPAPGTVLHRRYKGHTYLVEVLADGFAYDGQRYLSLSAVAHAITGGHWNGYLFFNLNDPNKEDT